MTPAVDRAAWILGLAVAGGVIVVVVLLVGTIIGLAAGIRREAVGIVEALREARDNTAALWEVRTTVGVAADIAEAARRVRGSLGG